MPYYHYSHPKYHEHSTLAIFAGQFAHKNLDIVPDYQVGRLVRKIPREDLKVF